MQLVPKRLDFRAKLALQKLFSVLPYGLYRFFVERHPKLKNADYDKMIKYYIDNCAFVKPHGLDLMGKTVIETGTGAALVDPLTFYLCGARRIYTFDIRLHVNPYHVWKIIEHYRAHLKYLASVMEIPLTEVEQRWRQLEEIRTAQDAPIEKRMTVNRYYQETRNFLRLLEVSKIRIDESKTIPSYIEPGSADIFFSNSVLQRPHEKFVIRMVRDAALALSDKGAFWHKIDSRDINWLYDKRISEYHYLQYSDAFLRVISSEVFSNQNRLRQSDFLRIFHESDFMPLYLRSQRPDNYIQQIERLRLHDKFQAYDVEDLAITNFIIYAVRKSQCWLRQPVMELIEFRHNIENQFL